MTRILAIMGSGETAPTMIKPHRALFDRLGPDAPAVVLDTPYGFQTNADDISARAVDYFAASVGRRVEVAGLRDCARHDPVGGARAMAAVAAARWVFAGPGSPTYALRMWRQTELPHLLADKLANEGCVIFASAAALTLGRYTVPVYEIYKVGIDPFWLEGLELAGFLGPAVAIIPHYDNAEGGNHDTRFCYLGEQRLAILEEQMDPLGWVLGVDEHTACIFDLDRETVTVVGNGVVTVRRKGRSTVVESGETLQIPALVELAFSEKGAAGPANGPTGTEPLGTTEPPSPRPPTALHSEIRRLEGEFDRALASGDVEAAIQILFELDDTMVAWSGDTTQSDAADQGRAAMRRMIARLGELARAGARDPREVVGGLVEALLAERAAARGSRRFEDADRIREALIWQGVEVRDTPDGTVWELG